MSDPDRPVKRQAAPRRRPQRTLQGDSREPVAVVPYVTREEMLRTALQVGDFALADRIRSTYRRGEHIPIPTQ